MRSRGRVRALVVGGAALLALLAAGCSPQVTVTIGEPAPTVERAAAPASTPTPRAGGPAPSPTPRPARSAPLGSLVSFSRLRSAPPSEIAIPALGIQAKVVEMRSVLRDGQWVWEIPAGEAGHHLGSANPGEPGNIVISGHVTTRTGAGIFFKLPEARPGQTVVVRSADGEFSYRIESVQIVSGDDTEALRQVGYEQLTLITCVPDGVYQSRVIVRARRV